MKLTPLALILVALISGCEATNSGPAMKGTADIKTDAAKRGSLTEGQLTFFLDEQTGEESVSAATAIPPLMGKDGKPTVVKEVRVTSDGGKTSKVAFLEKYTPETQLRLKDMPADDAQRPALLKEGLLIRLPEPGSPWVPFGSPEGERISQEAAGSGKGKPEVYFPKK